MRDPTHHPPLRRRAAFTLVELLVVIVVIGIVAAVVAVGISSALGNTEDKVTQTRLESLNTMLIEYSRNTGAVAVGSASTARKLPNFLANPGGAVAAPQQSQLSAVDFSAIDLSDRSSEAAAFVRTSDVLDRLTQSTANAGAFAALPASSKQSLQTTINGNDATLRFLTDGGGQPILFVPAAGMAGLDFADGTFGDDPADDGKNNRFNATHAVVSRDGGPFWVGAGADGSFADAGDNVYSTDVRAIDTSTGADLK